MIISDVLAWSARQWPDRECIVEIDPVQNTRRSLTYRQFDDRVNRLANALIDLGIKKGDMVLHFMRNRTEWMEAYFGIIRTGAIVVPLNFRFASADVEYAAKVVRPPLAIFEEELLEMIAPIRASLTRVKNYISIGQQTFEGIKNYEQLLEKYPPDPPKIPISEDDDLGVYFTSGTTGKPKPILFSHKNLYAAALCNGLTTPLPLNPSVIIQLPLYHTASFIMWFHYLFQGGKATISKKFGVHYLFRTVEQERVTEVNLASPHAIDIVNALKSGEIKLSDYKLDSLYMIGTGGQPFATGVLQDLMTFFPSCVVRHSYGLSEAVGGFTTTTVTREDLQRKLGSIGRPSVMVDCRVVGDDGKDVSRGELGELILRTERTMKGYYMNPEETANSIKNGWLYTGDIARMDEDGYIYIVDRKKDVIVSGGENVYPVELEDVLLNHPKILDAAVIGTPDERFGERVTAVITPKPGELLAEEEFFEWCQEKFPAYKRPRHVEFGDIPRTANHKILRSELRLKYTGKKTAF